MDSFNHAMILSYSQKEHYLGLSVGNDNWWRTHGMGCRETGDEEGSGNDDSGTVECTASYAVSYKKNYDVCLIFL